MKSTTLSTFALFALSASATNELQSKPFELQITSTNSTINGLKLNSCHEGALIQGPCLPLGFKGNAFSQTFYLNYTNAAHPNTGTLVFNNEAVGPGNKKIIIPQPMTFVYSPGSNVAGLIFEDGVEQPVVPLSFDKKERAYIAVPKVYTQGNSTDYNLAHLYRWNVCIYPWEGYTYTQLVWQLGEGTLNYQDCQKVGVKRVFIS